MKPIVTITETKVLSDHKFPLKQFDYQLTADGKTTTKNAEVYYRPDAVAVLLYNQQRQTFLLTSQFRLPAYLNGHVTGMMTEACAGLIDEGEAPSETACREVMEETGYKVKDLQKAGLVYTSVGGITERVHLFLGPYDNQMKTGKGGGLEAEGEAVKTTEISFTEAREKLLNGGFNDLKTIVLLQHYFLIH